MFNVYVGKSVGGGGRKGKRGKEKVCCRWVVEEKRRDGREKYVARRWIEGKGKGMLLDGEWKGREKVCC